jgi:hypothetical protein
MKHTSTSNELVERRGELLAEFFLQQLGAESVARPPQEFGFDFLVVFTNSQGGKNTFGVEVKSTERLLSRYWTIDRRTYGQLAHSTMPGFLLVADVKQNRVFFAFPPRLDTRRGSPKTVTIELTEINETTKTKLRDRLVAAQLQDSLS